MFEEVQYTKCGIISNPLKKKRTWTTTAHVYMAAEFIKISASDRTSRMWLTGASKYDQRFVTVVDMLKGLQIHASKLALGIPENMMGAETKSKYKKQHFYKKQLENLMICEGQKVVDINLPAFDSKDGKGFPTLAAKVPLDVAPKEAWLPLQAASLQWLVHYFDSLPVPESTRKEEESNIPTKSSFWCPRGHKCYVKFEHGTDKKYRFCRMDPDRDGDSDGEEQPRVAQDPDGDGDETQPFDVMAHEDPYCIVVNDFEDGGDGDAVSYTHLTLPTILLV